MSEASHAELLRASCHTVFTTDLLVRAVNTLYGYIGAGPDERDWDAILASDDPLAASEAALVTMYSDADFLLRNANHLSADYGAAQIDYTYRQIAERLGITHSSDWAEGTRYESAAELDDSAVKSQARRDFEQRQDDGGGGGGGGGAIQITAQNANVSPTTEVNATASTTNGDDTIETQFTFLTGTTINGGGGTDTLEVTDGGTFTLNNITNVEILDLTGANNASTVTQMSNDFTRVDLSGQGDTITATGLQDLDINGGAGSDTVIYADFGDLFNLALDPSFIRAQLNGGGGTDTIQVDDAINSGNDLNFNRAGSFERLVQNDTGAADITVTDAEDIREIDISTATNASTVDISGANVGMTITGGSAADQITGSTGVDEIIGGAGGDVIDGGVGDDDIEGNAGDDDLTGGNGDDTIAGGTGADTLDGGAGTDSLTGGAGDDEFTGSFGNDTFNVDAGTDTITDLSDSDVVVVSNGAVLTATVSRDYTATAASRNLSGNNNDAVFNVDINADAVDFSAFTVADPNTQGITVSVDDGRVDPGSVTGTDGDDIISAGDPGLAITQTLNGGAGDDQLAGGSGGDVINGDAGDDTITGGAGADAIDGGAGTDTFSAQGMDEEEAVFVGAVVNLSGNAIDGNDIQLATNNSLFLDPNLANLNAGQATNLYGNGVDNAAQSVDTLTSIENLRGSAGSDYLLGSDNANVINGDNGNDFIEGRGGTDTLTGGGGDDVFIFDGAVGATDQGNQITDFDAAGADRLDFTTNAATGTGITPGDFREVDNFPAPVVADSGLMFIIDAQGNTAASLDVADVAAFVADPEGVGNGFGFSNVDNVFYLAATDGTDTGIYLADDQNGTTVIDAGDLTRIVTLSGVTSVEAADFEDFA